MPAESDLPLFFDAQGCAQLRLQLLNQARTGPIWSLLLCCRRSILRHSAAGNFRVRRLP
ncbi:MAG: hypothetical protein MUC60_04020 [Oscillatoria sp. Prado101]|nr:hypothetical protein [Oscillatoria sp. Prado101]